MQKKFGVLVLGQETSDKLYTYLDAEIEAEKMVKRLNKTAYIFEVYSKVELSVEITKIEDYRVLDVFEINNLLDNVNYDNSDFLFEKKNIDDK